MAAPPFVRRGSIVLALLFWSLTAALAPADEVKTYETKYYTVTSNLTPLEMRGVIMRLDLLLPEYMRNFPALRGAITHKFEVRIFRGVDALHAAGAPADLTDSGYVPNTHKTFILVSQDLEHAMHEMQYQCFLQYCNEAIDNDQYSMPVWTLVGLAREFRWARFTGDGYVCGLMPYRIIEDTQKYLTDGRFLNANDVVNLTRNDETRIDTFYAHQAWFIAHYLDTGDNGAHHQAFSRYLHDVARGISHKEAWKKYFGDLDINTRWKEWMMAQKPESIKEGYAQALAQTLAAYLGRANLAGQHFNTVQELLNAVVTRNVKVADADWLPPDLPSLIPQWIKLVGPEIKFQITTNIKTPQVVGFLPDRTRIIATFDPARKGPRTTVEFDGPGHPKTVASPDKPDEAGENTIVLKSAHFGATNHWADVTEKCRTMIVGDMILTPRSLTAVFGINPAPAGQINWLDLHLIINGAAVHVVISDNPRIPPLRITTNLPAAADE